MNSKRIINIVTTCVLVAFGVVATILVPKNIITRQTAEQICNPMVSLEESNIVYSETKVYAVESKMSQNYQTDIDAVYEKYSSNCDYLVVKIPSKYQVETDKHYSVIYDDTLMPLNIDFYVGKNIIAGDTSIPAKAIISAVDSASRPINIIYKIIIAFFSVLYFAIVIPVGLKKILKKEKEK